FTGETMKEPGEGRCVLVNEVIGAHTANPLTGDFSVEIQNAFFMEDGHIQEPIRKAMLAGNIFGMLEGIVGMGAEPRRVGDTIVSSVRVHAMHLVG
ncbi:MAG: TldD/PmbA family protein, partial [Methanocalculus sp. MSAO_Arc1]